MARAQPVAASSYAWRPIFDDAPELVEVAGDARPAKLQEADYAAMARELGAVGVEAAGVVEALQLCERRHGHAAVSGALPFACALVLAAARGLGVPLHALAAHQGCATVGVLIGALVEDELRIPEPQRALRLGASPDRSGSPHLEFADVAAGCRLAETVTGLDPPAFERHLAYAELLRAVRFARGPAEVGDVIAQATRRLAATPAGRARESAFIDAVARRLARTGVRAPMAWLRYAHTRRASQSTGTPRTKDEP